jgi:hypothetical protein
VAEYMRFRLNAAKAGVTLALMALIAGIAERAQASPPQAGSASVGNFLKLQGLGTAISSNLLKIEQKVLKLDNAIASIDKKWVKLESTLSKTFYNAHKIDTTFLKITDASAQFLKITDASAQFLKLTDANAKFLKLTDTAADSNKLGGIPASGFFQGSGNVVSGALSSLSSTSQQLLGLPGGIIVVRIAQPPGGPLTLTIHNGTGVTLNAVGPVMGQVQQITLQPGDNTVQLVPAVQDSQFQIFPNGSTFPNVVSILIGLTPLPSSSQFEAVGQAFTGGV